MSIKLYRRLALTPLTGDSPCIRYFTPSKNNSIKNHNRFLKTNQNLCIGSAEHFRRREKRRCHTYFQKSPRRTPLHNRYKLIRRRLEFDESPDSNKHFNKSQISVPGNFIHAQNENVVPSIVLSIPEEHNVDRCVKSFPKFMQITKPNYKEPATPNTEKLVSTISPYQKFKLLGKGRFGTVIKNIYKGKNVAVKIFHNNNRNLRKSMHSEQNGIGLHHPNIVNIIKIVYPNTHSHHRHSIIIMECFSVADNLQIILDNEQFLITFPKILKFSSDICKGIQYLHSKNILHLDIKPKNVLTFPSDLCKLCDFGTSLKFGENIEETDILYQFKGTIQYCCPELLKGHSPTTASDIYSLGITMWQMQHRKLPYGYSIREESLIYQIAKNGLRPHVETPHHALLEKTYNNIYIKCWSQSPSNRLRIEQILFHLRCIRINLLT